MSRVSFLLYMRSLLNNTSHRPYVAIIAVCAALIAVLGFSVVSQVNAKPVGSTGQRLISLHEAGETRGILTDASTLRDALAQANIAIDPNDLVEPGLDSQLVASQYDVNIYRARPVTIIDGSIRKKIISPYQTANQIATHADIALQDEDTTTMSANTNMVGQGVGLQVSVKRATPVTLIMYGKSIQAYTQAKTVDEMLRQKNITLGKADSLSLAGSTAITANMTVELWRNGTQTIAEDQEIAFPVQQVKDADREVGYKEIKIPGEKGAKTVSYEVNMKNGTEISRKEIQSVTTKEPKQQVEVVGTKLTNTFSGDFAGALARLRSCEGSYTSNTGNGYYGAYQYDIGTWGGYKGYANASQAPAAVQDEKAWITYQARGWQPWPSCRISQGLQDIYR